MPAAVSVTAAIDSLTPLVGRQPGETEFDWATSLGTVGAAGIFAVHYSGVSEWERHTVGDEIVMVLEGRTTLFLLVDGEDVPHELGPMELVVVPQGVWHRFETPELSKILTVTPQPSDHSIHRPSDTT